jgi:hypothetical protein
MTRAAPTPEQLETIRCLLDWLEVRTSVGQALPSNVEALREAIDHSALLRRLLAGKPLLAAPPPLSFGQPWYELGEVGHAECYVKLGFSHLEINGMAWPIVERRGEDEFLVRQPGDKTTYLVWRLHRLSSIPASETRWMIERHAPAVV